MDVVIGFAGRLWAFFLQWKQTQWEPQVKRELDVIDRLSPVLLAPLSLQVGLLDLAVHLGNGESRASLRIQLCLHFNALSSQQVILTNDLVQGVFAVTDDAQGLVVLFFARSSHATYGAEVNGLSSARIRG